MEDITIYARDLDGSMHICAKGDPGAVAYVPAEPGYLACPNCGGVAEIPLHAIKNADAYGTAATVRMECCGYASKLEIARSYLLIDAPSVKKDDWGAECKTHEPA